MSEYIFTVIHKLDHNAFRQIVALNVFSAGNLTLYISHEYPYLWTNWSHVITVSLYSRSKNKMYADDSIYQGINPIRKIPNMYGYAFTVRQDS